MRKVRASGLFGTEFKVEYLTSDVILALFFWSFTGRSQVGKGNTLELIRQTGVVAIMRAKNSDQLLDAHDFDTITERARRFQEEVEKGRAS